MKERELTMMNFDIPEKLQNYLDELDQFIEKE